MSRPPIWSWFVLAAILVLAVWWRAHTFGPTVRERLGWNPWPVVGVASEPIDCDEAVYTYVGRRLLRGDVLYRDLTEPKPPGGYWLYTLGVALGGANELMVRLLPLPLILATIVLIAGIGRRLGGTAAGLLAAFLYAIAGADPYLFGNGSNLEHPMNFGAVAALACLLIAWDRDDGGRRWVVASGLAIGFACLFKQVAALHAVVFAIALLARRHNQRSWPARCGDVVALGLGVLILPALAAVVLIGQGAGREAYEEVFVYAAAMARDVPPEPNAPPALVRWFTGNADPQGVLPPPFGKTNYLVWWGLGTWPLWLVTVPGFVALLSRGPKADAPDSRPAAAGRWLLVAWTLSAWVQVLMPRLFWQHYYLLPLPGVVLVAALLATQVGGARGLARRGLAVAAALAILATIGIQIRSYLLVDPQQLTVRYKGGGQWVALRDQGRDLARRTRGWDDPRYFNWGWQSPIFVYSGMDGVTRHFFADPLMKAFGDGGHPLIRPRLDRIMADLEAHPPEVALIADPPFPALGNFLRDRYLVWQRYSPDPSDGRGLYIEKSRYGDFVAKEAATSP